MMRDKREESRQLVDRYGRRHTVLRISVTDRCNLRCFYCMPHRGMEFKDRRDLLTYEEIFRVARVFTELGITKIRLTGGEPMVRKNLVVLIERLAGLKGLRTLAMTTNAVLLKEHVKQLRVAGLKALNVSLDTFRRDRFIQLAHRDLFDRVLEGIQAALNAGFAPLKLNMVVIGGFNDDEILDFVAFAEDKPVNVRFIEFMPFRDNRWTRGHLVPYREIRERIERHYSLRPLENEPSAVARDFAIDGAQGSVSFVTSMTDSFCATCNRLRLTSDGSIKSCLFHPAEVPLRERLRDGLNDDDLVDFIQEALLLKPEAHDPMETLAEQIENRPMIAIGG